MDEIWEFFYMIAIVVMFVGATGAALFGGIGYGIAKPSCYAQWTDSGMPVRWSFYGGCQLQMTDGKWLVDEAYLKPNKRVTVTP